MDLSRYRKLWIALAGVVTQAIAQGLIDGDAAAWAAIVVASLTAAAVFGVPNEEN